MFNSDSRTINAARTSFFSTLCNVLSIVMGLIFRMVFVQILAVAYLGINGLFTNVLSILSFAELGITSAIIYRFYEPISRNDIKRVGQLMHFFRRVYRIVALVMLLAGLAFMPFLNFLIKDTSELPADVNLTVVYLLFLLQTVASYLFVYKQTILNVDQRTHIISITTTLTAFFKYVLQLLVLFITKKYVLVLAIGLLWTLVTNYAFSEWASRKYKEVFAVRESLPKEDRLDIISDTKATLCHKIGITVLSGTDNIILSKFAGIIATGLFSNYSLIFSSLIALLNQLLGSFTSSIGSSHVEQSEELKYQNFKRLLFANLWVTSVCTVCLYTLIDDFISIWVGSDMLLSVFTVAVLCAQFFLESSRVVSMSNTHACGLFVRDKARPLIEATINVFVSIYFVKRIGIAGVFLGTIVSHLCTVTWREPYLLYKYEFKVKPARYWSYFLPAVICTALTCWAMQWMIGLLAIETSNLILWIVKATLVFAICNAMAVVIFHKNKDFIYYKNLLISSINSRKTNRG